jgi:hypothetical protein
MALVALFVVLLRFSMLRLIKVQGREHVLQIESYAGIDQKERIKRPAFLSGIQD